MIPRSYTARLVGVAVLLVGFGLDASAIAQTNYEFSATYDTVVTIDPSFMPDEGIFRATITGSSIDAPYGLTNLPAILTVGLTLLPTYPPLMQIHPCLAYRANQYFPTGIMAQAMSCLELPATWRGLTLNKAQYRVMVL